MQIASCRRGALLIIQSCIAFQESLDYEICPFFCKVVHLRFYIYMYSYILNRENSVKSGIAFLIVDGSWGAWDNWSVCTRSCGGGIRKRTRTCSNPAPKHGGRTCPGPKEQIQSCNMKQCPGNIIIHQGHLTIIRRRRGEYWWIKTDTKSRFLFTEPEVNNCFSIS